MQLENSSSLLLQMMKPRFIFNGHDHNGCYSFHDGIGNVVKTQLPLETNYSTGAFEITLRSFMAEFQGYSGMFEIHQSSNGEYVYSVQTCGFWYHLTVWFVVIGSIVVIVLAALYDLTQWIRKRTFSPKQQQRRKQPNRKSKLI